MSFLEMPNSLPAPEVKTETLTAVRLRDVKTGKFVAAPSLVYKRLPSSVRAGVKAGRHLKVETDFKEPYTKLRVIAHELNTPKNRRAAHQQAKTNYIVQTGGQWPSSSHQELQRRVANMQLEGFGRRAKNDAKALVPTTGKIGAHRFSRIQNENKVAKSSSTVLDSVSLGIPLGWLGVEKAKKRKKKSLDPKLSVKLEKKTK